jgi:hypothetical protein
MNATHTAQLSFPLSSILSAGTAHSPVIPRSGALRSGDRITCSARFGADRTCGCGSTSFRVDGGRGPHAAQMRCERFGARGRWIAGIYLNLENCI